MRFFSKEETTISVDRQIETVLDRMSTIGLASEEYKTMMDHLERLYEMKAKARPNRVSRDTIVLVVGNLLGIIVIVAYEQKHVMTSKGLSQLIRPKEII